MLERLTVQSVRARAVDVPLERAIRTAMGTIASAPLVLIDLLTREGVVGRAYVFPYTRPALKPLADLVGAIGAEIVGRPAAPRDLMRHYDRRFRLLGWEGLVGMALGGLDMAVWDALGRAAGQPVARLLGAEPRGLRAYDSYGAIDPKADEAVLRASVERGFRAIKVKLGEGDLAHDLAALRGIRAIVGPELILMADYNQSLSVAEASRRLPSLAEFDLHWVEEPVRHEDLAGHAAVRAVAPIPIQTGENWWFPADAGKAVAAGASDLAMLDIMKIGGVTGWQDAAAVCSAAGTPVSSHLFIEASAHALAATASPDWLEFLDIAGAVLAEPAALVDGAVLARGPGLGIDWDEAAVARYAVA